MTTVMGQTAEKWPWKHFQGKLSIFCFSAAILSLIIEHGPKYVFQGSFPSIYPENQRLGGLVIQKVGVNDIFKLFYLILG